MDRVCLVRGVEARGRRVSLAAADSLDDQTVRAWAALEARAIEPNAFLSPHFILPALRHLDGADSVWIVLVHDGDGVLRAAGVFREAAPNRAIPLPHLIAYRSRHSYLSGLLVDRHEAAATLGAMFDGLARAGVHALLFEQLPAEGPLAGLLQATTHCHELGRIERAILHPRDAGASHLEQRIGPRLTGARRLLRRLREEGQVDWQVHRTGESLARCVETHLELEAQGWKGDAGSALASKPENESFFREMSSGFGDEGRALFTELSVDGQPIAVTSNFVSGDRGFCFKIGWAAAYARFSPGQLNEVEFIRNAPEICQGLTVVDSGAQPGSFIERLWPDRYALASVAVPLDLRGRLAVASTALARRLRKRPAPPREVRCIVLSCGGAGEASLNVVRSLGPAGVRIVLVTEDADDLAAASRWVGRVAHVPGFTSDPRLLVEAVAAIARDEAQLPVLFPTADPDLLLASRHARELSARARVLAAPFDLLSKLTDKRRFAALAERRALPVPRSFFPVDAGDLATIVRDARAPTIVKPAHPLAWNSPRVRAIVGTQKAIRCDDAESLRTLLQQLAEHNLDFLVQELVPGPDENHVDLHALIDPRGTPVAWFTGQKLRIYPAHAGSGCFVKSVTVPEVVERGLDALRRCGLTGLANLNFKRHADTGEHLLLEINPRVSQWNILAARAGVNLPLAAYELALGESAAPPPTQRDGLTYVNLQKDLAAFRTYRREGLLSTASYLRSVTDPRLVHQVFDSADPGPMLRVATLRRRALASRLLRGYRTLLS